VNEDGIRERLSAAIGEPPGSDAALRRLEAHLDGVRELRTEPGHSRAMALMAVALSLLLVAGLLATQAVRASRRATAPAATPAAAIPTTAVPATAVPAAATTPNVGAAATVCLAGVPDQFIEVDLARQELVAYDHGCPILTTPVTTARLSIVPRTIRATVSSKNPQYVLRSPWPKDSPYWFPDTTVNDYIAYGPPGGALNSAEWEPLSAYGPGSEVGPYAGDTIHVPQPALDRLYAWVQVGATIMVMQGA
jgi:hypothetical protein